MEVRVIDHALVRELLPMGACLDVMADALQSLSRGDGLNPLRQAMWLPERFGLLGTMPGHLADRGVMGIKVVSVFPHNHGTPYDSHQGCVLLFETRHGRPLAIVDASEITAIRTAAVSGVATRLLSRADSAVLAVLGSGVQADTHVEAMRVARPVREVRVWSRTPAHAAAFAARHGAVACASAEEAVAGADIVCTTTASAEPVLQGAWLAPGTHVNAVGSSVRSARELDVQAVARSRLYVDRRESTLNESGALAAAIDQGAVGPDHIVAELGEVLLGQAPARRDDREITLFKSLGLAVEDVAAAHHVYQQALEADLGTAVTLSGPRR